MDEIAGGQAGREAVAGAPAQILVVDDDADLATIISEALASRGYRVETARNGREALARVDTAMPRLILLDMWMPVMDGWTCARQLRERYGRRIPIVVITAAQDSQLRASEIGAAAELGKPFELKKLFAVVEDALVGAPQRGQ